MARGGADGARQPPAPTHTDLTGTTGPNSHISCAEDVDSAYAVKIDADLWFTGELKIGVDLRS